jgi:hypothetical protein
LQKKNFSNILAKGETQEMFKTISDKKKKTFLPDPADPFCGSGANFRTEDLGFKPRRKKTNFDTRRRFTGGRSYT